MEPFYGQIQAFGFNFAPRNWALCNGQIISIAENTALFSLLSTFYGGDGRTSFGLPDLRGRVMVGMGSGPGLSPRQIGQSWGYEHTILNANQMPVHSHTAEISGASVTVKANSTTGDSATPAARSNKTVLSGLSQGTMYGDAEPDTDLNIGGGAVDGTVTVEPAGASQSFNNMQPYTVVNMSIATVGIYPSRN